MENQTTSPTNTIQAFYDRWRDFFTKAEASIIEIKAFEEDTDVLIASVSKEVWVQIHTEISAVSPDFYEQIVQKPAIFGVKLRKIHMETTNQFVIQREGVTLVARLFHIPPKPGDKLA